MVVPVITKGNTYEVSPATGVGISTINASSFMNFPSVAGTGGRLPCSWTKDDPVGALPITFDLMLAVERALVGVGYSGRRLRSDIHT
jgi:hypothetical protein